MSGHDHDAVVIEGGPAGLSAASVGRGTIAGGSCALSLPAYSATPSGRRG